MVLFGVRAFSLIVVDGVGGANSGVGITLLSLVVEVGVNTGLVLVLKAWAPASSC